MKHLLSIAFLLFVTSGFSQTTFMNVYGNTTNIDYAHSLVATFDGGYALFGGSTYIPTDTSYMCLVKINTNGDTIWSKYYHPNQYNMSWGYSMQQTADSGFVLLGSTTPAWQTTPADYYLIKTDKQGNQQWSKTFGGNNGEDGRFIIQTSDGGYALFGESASYGTFQDMYLLKTNENGDSLWANWYGGPLPEQGNCVRQTSDGGFILCGRTRLNINDYSMLLVKTDSLGNEQWSQAYDPNLYWNGLKILQANDDGYYITGIGNSGSFLCKTNSSGSIEWTANLPITAIDFQFTNDSGFIFSGYIVGGGNFEAAILKTNSLGNEQWQETFGGSRDDKGQYVNQAPDGGYILAGFSNSFGSGSLDYDFLAIKTDSTGYVDSILITIPEKQINDQATVELYPNPFTQTATITLQSIQLPATLTIYDNLGRAVRQEKITSQQHTIQRNYLSGGIYFYRIANRSGKFIITSQ